jgi:putative hemolysin
MMNRANRFQEKSDPSRRNGNPFRHGFFSGTKRPINRILCLDRLRDIYEHVSSKEGESHFLKAILDALNVSFRVSVEDISRIPQKGRVIVVANHPFGGIDGIIMASILLDARRDVKFLVNYILALIPEFRQMFIPVDPFGKKESIPDNIKPLRSVIKWLRNDGMLCVFPSGEVSHTVLDCRTKSHTD